MSKLTNLTKLIELINEDTTIKRFKELESIIDQDDKLSQDFEDLQSLQKIMVNAETKKTKNEVEATTSYNIQLNKVMDHYLMSEYLDLLEVVNNDLQLIKDIITKEINVDLD